MTLDRDALFIGGTWTRPATDAVLEVVSPHTEEVVVRVPDGSAADIDAAVAMIWVFPLLCATYGIAKMVLARRYL